MAITIEINTVQNKDCMEGMAEMDSGSVDLVIADPPYFQGNGGGGGAYGTRNKSFRDQIGDMMCGISDECLEQMARVCKRVNMYIFCSVLQIPQYLAFATRHGYKFDILTWHKTNAVPACGGKYMPDTESTEKVQFFKDQNEKCLRFITFLSTNRLNKAMIGRKRRVKRLFLRY